MKIRSKKTAAIALLLAFVAMGGCLSEDPAPGFVSEAPDPGGNPNTAPAIGGNPASAVRIGDRYSFTPTAADPDNDALTFSIENKPSWANFDTGTGSLTGTPTLADVGVASNIVITVSDGQTSTSLRPFSVEVTQVSLGSVSLSWTAPTQNEDGTALVDLAGFKIYYGTSPGNYTNQIRIDNASITTYMVDNLTPGTYFFSATAFNVSGIESRFSGEATKTVN